MEKEVKVIDYGFFTRDGLDFEYHVSGNAQGEALVMLSGNGGTTVALKGSYISPFPSILK